MTSIVIDSSFGSRPWKWTARRAAIDKRKGGRGGRETPCPRGREGAGAAPAVPAAVGETGCRGGGATAARVGESERRGLRKTEDDSRSRSSQARRQSGHSVSRAGSQAPHHCRTRRVTNLTTASRPLGQAASRAGLQAAPHQPPGSTAAEDGQTQRAAPHNTAHSTARSRQHRTTPHSTGTTAPGRRRRPQQSHSRWPGAHTAAASRCRRALPACRVGDLGLRGAGRREPGTIHQDGGRRTVSQEDATRLGPHFHGLYSH